MPLFDFGKKKDEAPASGPAAGTGPNTTGQVDEAKAAKFFQHARTVQETGNLEYGLQLWLQGIRFQPQSMDAMQGFFKCCAEYLSTPEGDKAKGREVFKQFPGGKAPVEAYLRAILEWGMRPDDSVLGVRALESAAVLGLTEQSTWLGQAALGRVLADKRPRKDLLLKIADAFNKVNLPDRAIVAAEQAYKLDPSDGELQAYIRNLAASATMTKGGYDKAGQEGGFRSNIRDATKQRQLDEAERIVKTEDVLERLVREGEEAMAQRPGDLPTIEVLAKRYLERAKAGDEERAHKLYTQAHASTGQFRFREMAGDIRIRQAMRKVRELEKMHATAKAAGSPETEMIEGMLASEREALTRLEMEEYKLRVVNYPTDLTRKFELGRRHFALGNNDEAIGLFQETQVDAKVRVASLNYLGQCFFRIGYFDESVQTFRAALEAGDRTPEVDLEIRYSLMVALMEQGRQSRSVDAVREADKLASAIAMKQFNYRDIRARRDEVKKLLTELAPNG